MNKILLILIATFTTVFGTFAAPPGPLDRGYNPASETFALNGKFYHNVKIISVHDGLADLDTKEGDISVTWSSLPLNFQSKHANEKIKLEEHAAAKAERAANKAAGIVHLVGRVLQKVPEGILIRCEQPGGEPSGAVSSGASKGLNAGGVAPANVPFRMGDTFGTFLLKDYPKQDVVDGDFIEATKAYQADTYSYVDTLGARRTVRAYTCKKP